MSYQDALLKLATDFSLTSMDAASPVAGIRTCGDVINLRERRDLGGGDLEVFLECTEACVRSGPLASVQFLLVGAYDTDLTSLPICYGASMPLGVSLLTPLTLPIVGDKFSFPIGTGYHGGLGASKGPGTTNVDFGRPYIGIRAINWALVLASGGTVDHLWSAGKFTVSVGLQVNTSRSYPGNWGIR